MMPTLFLGHGSPMNAIGENKYTKTLNELGKSLPRPKAILMISAHWETQGSFLTGMERLKTIHDFYGFPQALFNVQYPASGSPELAENISKKISNINIDLNNWGFDHGTWSVLVHLYPQADIPVVQLSLDRKKSMREHFELGQKLKYLRDDGVMIIGSGNIVHNLRAVNWGENPPAYEWAIKFDEWVKEKLISRNFDSLIDDILKMNSGKLSIPTLEHYLPLLYIIGSSNSRDKLIFDFEGIHMGSMSMRSLRFQ